MSQVYFPSRFLDVPASPPHEGDPAYRVSIGIEHWGDGTAQHVYKVQMMYGGRVAGRKSPSYPEGSDDLERVMKAMSDLRAGAGQKSRGTMTVVGPEKGMPTSDAHFMLDVRQEASE